MIELLISLSITAMLLTATAVATRASFVAYEINQEQALLMQRARVTLNFVTTQIRTNKLHAAYTSSAATSFATGATVTDTGVQMYDQNDKLLTFRYDAPNKRVLAVLDGTTHVMASGVEAFSVRLEPMRSAESVRTGGSWNLLRRATVTITVRTNATVAAASETTGKQTVTLSASAVPRRNAW